jgi:hypothetical protein
VANSGGELAGNGEEEVYRIVMCHCVALWLCMLSVARAADNADGTIANPPFYADYSKSRNDCEEFVLCLEHSIASHGPEAFGAVLAGFNNIPEPNSLSLVLGIVVVMPVLLRERSEIFGFRHQLAGNSLPVA